MNGLIKGQAYSRKTLAKIWGYKSYHALACGMFTPQNDKKIILFITKENQTGMTTYQNSFDGKILKIELVNNNQKDQRMANAGNSGDQIYLFYREKDNSEFIYHGEIEVIHYTLSTNKPSIFEYTIKGNWMSP